MRIATFAAHFAATFFRSARDPGAARYRADLGAWFQGLDGAAEREEADATRTAAPSPSARLAEFRRTTR